MTELDMEEKITIRLPDKSEKVFPKGVTVLDIAESISPGLARKSVAGRLSNELVDLAVKINEDHSLELIRLDSKEGLDILRHTAAHIMAQAIKNLYPGTKLAIGPTIDNGFYYDVDCPEKLSVDDLPKIEKEMSKIVQQKLGVVRKTMAKNEAISLFEGMDEKYKVELIEELEDHQVSLYKQGDFIDLCRGPHVPHTGFVKAFKLLSVAGAYWRGDSTRPMLQRVYGTAFSKKSELEDYLEKREEAARRDHRKVGRDLDLFSFRDESPGFAFWHPKGHLIYQLLEELSREVQKKHGYLEVSTPWIFRPELWKTSGHWDHYKEDMFIIEAEGEIMGLKPMNCPAHCLLYKRKTRSYRDLPIRYAEYSPLSRFELSGTLHGLMRVRGFHQDDAHLFVREDQIEEEISKVITIVDEIYSAFGMSYVVKLSTRPDDFLGDIENWNRAEEALARALEKVKGSYIVKKKDGAFYGPKIDFDITDALGRAWQCATVQLDFQFPQRFDLTFVDTDGLEKRPVLIHRAVLGAVERFIGILTEHFAGAFPTWLHPVQVCLIPVGKDHLEYAESLKKRMSRLGIRVEVDKRDEKVGYKIREAQVQKVPYMIVIGDKEMASHELPIRHRKRGDMGKYSIEAFVEMITEDIDEKKLDGGINKKI